MDNIVSRRVGKVFEFGNTLALSLREELLDIGLDKGSEVKITLFEEDKKKRIEIEKV